MQTIAFSFYLQPKLVYKNNSYHDVTPYFLSFVSFDNSRLATFLNGWFYMVSPPRNSVHDYNQESLVGNRNQPYCAFYKWLLFHTSIIFILRNNITKSLKKTCYKHMQKKHIQSLPTILQPSFNTVPNICVKDNITFLSRTFYKHSHRSQWRFDLQAHREMAVCWET